MKTYKDITKRYLSKNKGRTITTICGIILSISLITAIMFFVKGMHQNFIDREVDASGAYHIAFTGLSKDEVDRMSSHPGVKNVGLFNNLALINESNGEYDYNYSVDEVTKGQEHLFPADIVEGRFGENNSEIVVDVNTIKEMKKAIGDSIAITTNGRESIYKIVGIVDKPWEYDSKKEGKAIISKEKIELSENTLIAFEGNLKGLRRTLDELITMTDKEAKENIYYLSYIGAGSNVKRNEAMVAMTAIIISLVIVSTVLVIKNAFYISIVSRLKEFGLLKSIGATSKQLRTMILKEATIIAFIAIPFGLLFGTVAIIAIEKVMSIISDNLLIKIKLEWWILVLAAILGFVTTYVCALLPALELKKISPLAAIDNRNGVKKEKIKKNKHSFIEKFFNIRTVMAYRNIKRNKKRYNSTIIGLTISMVLFIVFTSYMRIALNDTLGYTNGSTDIPDITSYVQGYEKTKIDALLNKLYEVKGIDILCSSDRAKGLFDQVIERKDLNNDIFKDDSGYMSKRDLDNNYSLISPNIYNSTLDKAIVPVLNKYLIDGKIDLEKMKNNNGIILVNERIHYFNDKYRGKVSNLKVGDKVYLSSTTVLEESEKEAIKNLQGDKVKEFEIIAIVSELPVGLEEYDYVVYNDNLKGLLSEEQEQYLGTDSILIKVTDKKNKESIINNIEAVFNSFSLEYSNMDDMLRETKESIYQIKFLVYGFVIVLGLISSTNIFNTMSTSVIFRRREIAALRAIGMSKKEMRNMIIKEGALYGIISTVYATIIGSTINFMLYRQLLAITRFKFKFNLDVILLVGIIGTLVGIIASLIPLRKIDNSSIIEDLKGE